jgi:putative addiction module component (TIGR02574 family)
MSPTVNNLAIDQLSVEERLELMGRLWDSIPETPEDLPVPEWHRQELERRIQAADADPDAGIPWPEVKSRLRRGRMGVL